MANCVENLIRMYGDEKEIEKVCDWLLGILKAKGSNFSLGDVEGATDDKDRIFFSDMMGYPSTFKEWDTTNHPRYANHSEVSDRFATLQNLKGNKFFQFTPSQLDGLDKGEEIQLTKQQKKDFANGWNEIIGQQENEYGVVGWYDYNRMYFGCKWDEYLTEVLPNGDQLILRVTTPWTYPKGFFNFLQEKFSELTFEIFTRDECDNFMGILNTQREGDKVWLDYTEVVYGENTEEDFFEPWIADE